MIDAVSLPGRSHTLVDSESVLNNLEIAMSEIAAVQRHSPLTVRLSIDETAYRVSPIGSAKGPQLAMKQQQQQQQQQHHHHQQQQQQS